MISEFDVVAAERQRAAVHQRRRDARAGQLRQRVDDPGHLRRSRRRSGDVDRFVRNDHARCRWVALDMDALRRSQRSRLCDRDRFRRAPRPGGVRRSRLSSNGPDADAQPADGALRRREQRWRAVFADIRPDLHGKPEWWRPRGLDSGRESVLDHRHTGGGNRHRCSDCRRQQCRERAARERAGHRDRDDHGAGGEQHAADTSGHARCLRAGQRGGVAALRQLRHAGRRRDRAGGIDRRDGLDARQHRRASASSCGATCSRARRRRRSPARRRDPRNGKVFIANATFVDGARPDVEALYPTTPADYRAGWGYLMLTWGLWNQGNGTYTLLRVRVRPGGQRRDDRHARPSSSATTRRPSRSGRSTRRRSAAIASRPELRLGADAEGQRRGDVQDPVDGVQVSIDSGPLQPVVYGDARTRHRRRLPRLLEHAPRPAGTSSSTGRR